MSASLPGSSMLSTPWKISEDILGLLSRYSWNRFKTVRIRAICSGSFTFCEGSSIFSTLARKYGTSWIIL